MSSKAIIYTRFSPRPNADESDSNEKQERSCREYCSRQGYEVVGVFEDRGMSGKSEDRPGLHNAIAAIKRDMVLVVRWRSRLARGVFLHESIKRDILSRGGRIEAAEEGNGTSPDDEFIEGILALMAQRERRYVAMRTKYAMLRYQNVDRRVMSKVLPYGWEFDPENEGMTVPCIAEQEILSEMHDMRERLGMSFRAIARELDLMGLPPRIAEEWSHRTVAKILRRDQEG